MVLRQYKRCFPVITLFFSKIIVMIRSGLTIILLCLGLAVFAQQDPVLIDVYKRQLMEMLGGGYYYVDTYSQDHNRKTNLRVAAKRLAVSMRQYQIKLLGIMAMDVKSEAAKEAYQVYVDANDQLEGIVVLQYSPYAGGEGEVLWVCLLYTSRKMKPFWAKL